MLGEVGRELEEPGNTQTAEQVGPWAQREARTEEDLRLPPLWESFGKAPRGILKPPSSRGQPVSVSRLGPSWTGSSPWGAGLFLEVAMDSRTRQLVCWSAGA